MHGTPITFDELRIKVAVVSDAVYKGEREDVSGKLALKILGRGDYEIIPNDANEIRRIMKEDYDVIFFLGGTGLSDWDLTVDVVSEGNVEIKGVGEIFRLETYKKEGWKALLSRAGGWVNRKEKRIYIVTPGNPNAVRLMIEIVKPALAHMVSELKGLRRGLNKASSRD